MRKIDTHQHFWNYNSEEFGWIGDTMRNLKQDFLPTDLEPLLKEVGIEGTIAVQARQCLEETDWLLRLADTFPFIKGVTGWLDLCSDQIDQQLEKYGHNPSLKAVRHVIHDEPDVNFMLRDDFMRGIAKLAPYNLVYEILIFPIHLQNTLQFVKQFPQQKFIVDHIAKPYIKKEEIEPWACQMRELASFENVYCKISGMVTEANWTQWKREDFTPYLDNLFDCFGAKRITIGSDWPVCTLCGTYSEVISIPETYIQKLSISEQENIWAHNAIHFYAL